MPNMQELKQMQALPLELKIIKTQQRIKDFYSHFNGMVYVSFSGGKDSTVLKHLVETTIDVHDVPSIFVNTGLEFPEIQKFAKAQKNVEVLYPQKRFNEVLRDYGYPVISKEVSNTIYEARTSIANGKTDTYSIKKIEGRLFNKQGMRSPYNCAKYKYLLDADFKISPFCCDVMKKKPCHDYEKATGRQPIIGTMANESMARTSVWIAEGCNAFKADGKGTSKPLSFWTEQDILEYIRRFNLPYCSEIYGDIVEDFDGNLHTTGCDRTGCIFCMFGVHLDNYPNHFQRLQKTHPKQWRYCINGGGYVDGVWQPTKEGLGLGHVLDAIGVEYQREPDLFDEEE